MSFDLSGLSAYTDENKMDLIRASILKGRTLDLIQVQPDIKSSATINILSSSPIWQAGACGFNAQGTTELTQRTITVSDVKNNETLCLNDLEAYYTQSMMKAGSYNEDIPFEQLYSEEKAEQSASMVEVLAWQGDTAGAGNLVFADGFLKTLDADGDVITGTTKALDAANIVAAFDEMVSAIPVDAINSDDQTLFCGYDTYRTYANALRNANLFAYTGAENQGGDFTQMVPGTNVKVVAVKGLNGTDRIVLGEASNFYAGVDLLNDAEQFRIFYSEDNDEVRVIQKFKIGFNYAFGARVVTN